jgi:hypothetical protein
VLFFGLVLSARSVTAAQHAAGGTAPNWRVHAFRLHHPHRHYVQSSTCCSHLQPMHLPSPSLGRMLFSPTYYLLYTCLHGGCSAAAFLSLCVANGLSAFFVLRIVTALLARRAGRLPFACQASCTTYAHTRHHGAFGFG